MRYAVYICGDEEPTAIFPTLKDAETYLEKYEDEEYNWMDRRIEEVP